MRLYAGTGERGEGKGRGITCVEMTRYGDVGLCAHFLAESAEGENGLGRKVEARNVPGGILKTRWEKGERVD